MAASAVFVLSLIGFGSKAGIMPLHVWLPAAHAVAPSHVSAIMSGVNIKVALYGFIRVVSLLPAPPAAWGAIVLALGVASGVLGVTLAIGQHDLKRLLAYHSIENIGIIVIGLGLAHYRPFARPRRLGDPRHRRLLAARLEPRPVQVPAVLLPAPSSIPSIPAKSIIWAASRSRCPGLLSAS